MTSKALKALSTVAFLTIASATSILADDCNSGRAGADCDQTDAFNSAAQRYSEAVVAAEGLDVGLAFDFLNLGMQAAGLAANMQSLTSGPVSNTYGQGAPTYVPRTTRQSTITGIR